MNASMKVFTPEQKWHAGRQADAFFGLLDQYNQLLEEQNKLKKANTELRQALVEIRADIYDSSIISTPSKGQGNPLPINMDEVNRVKRNVLLRKITQCCDEALNR